MAKKSKVSYHHGDLRQALINAGIELLSERGVAELSLREVAKRAGVSHTAPYRHFDDKHALLSAIAAVGFQRLADAMQHSVEENPEDPLQQIYSAARKYVELAVGNSEIFHLMFGGVILCDSRPDYLNEISQAAFNGLLNIIENAANEKLYKDEDSMNLALVVWSSVHGLSMLISAGELHDLTASEQDRNNMVNMLVRLLLSGIMK